MTDLELAAELVRRRSAKASSARDAANAELFALRQAERESGIADAKSDEAGKILVLVASGSTLAEAARLFGAEAAVDALDAELRGAATTESDR